VLVALGNLHDRVKVYCAFLQPLAISLHNGVGTRRAGANLSAHQSRVELRIAIGGDESRLLKSQDVCEQSAFIVCDKPHRLSADPDAGGGPKFLNGVEASLFRLTKTA
jgi:hypothetical protein